MILTLLSWLGSALVLLGAWLMGTRARAGFSCSLSGAAVWVVWAALSGQWAILLLNGVFCVVYFRNLMVWRGES